MELTKKEKINILGNGIESLTIEREKMQYLVELNFKQVEEQRKEVAKFDFLIDLHTAQVKEIKKL